MFLVAALVAYHMALYCALLKVPLHAQFFAQCFDQGF